MDQIMKHRNGFVSNSSSSSFVLDKNYLSEKQLETIRNYQIEAVQIVKDKFKSDSEWWSLEDELESLDDSPWEIQETENKLRMYTWMDNFDMRWFLDQINIPEEAFLNEKDNLHTTDLDDWEKIHNED